MYNMDWCTAKADITLFLRFTQRFYYITKWI
jgi:hypothetical protein